MISWNSKHGDFTHIWYIYGILAYFTHRIHGYGIYANMTGVDIDGIHGTPNKKKKNHGSYG